MKNYTTLKELFLKYIPSRFNQYSIFIFNIDVLKEFNEILVYNHVEPISFRESKDFFKQLIEEKIFSSNHPNIYKKL